MNPPVPSATLWEYKDRFKEKIDKIFGSQLSNYHNSEKVLISEKIVNEDVNSQETDLNIDCKKSILNVAESRPDMISKKEVLDKIRKAKVISENQYGNDDGTDEILLTKYLIDRENLIKALNLEEINAIK